MNFIFKNLVISKRHTLNITVACWFLAALITAASETAKGASAINNYLIFKHVFFHTVSRVNLYDAYPLLYADMNHYGIVFSMLIAPFALMPDWLGSTLWCMANAALLFYAVTKMPVTKRRQIVVLAICLIELLTSIHNMQFNPMMTAFIILPFILVQQKKEYAATFFIAAGILIKLYGIVALVTFLFSKSKKKYAGSFICWMVLLFCLPMIISSPDFVLHSYGEWYRSIADKNIQNTSLNAVVSQNISFHGMLQRIFILPQLHQLWVLVPAAIGLLLPLTRFKMLYAANFQLHYMAACLTGVVIFSSSAESSTYIIAVAGVAAWFVLGDMKSAWNRALLAFTILFTVLSPTDLYPAYIRENFFVKYSLKSLPCLLVWIVLIFKLLTKDFRRLSNLQTTITHQQPTTITYDLSLQDSA